MSVSSEEFIKNIEGMTVLELSQLVKGLEERFGVSAAAMAMPMAAAGGASAAGAAVEAPEEKTEFSVVLTSVGEKKINVIKVAREVNSALGLKEAKDLVEAVPATVKEGVSKDEAETIKKKFADAGATVEIK